VSYPSARWRPTPAHLRAVVGGLLVMLTAVLARRPDLLVLAAPLACAAVWAIMLRPTRVPVIRQWIGQEVLREGEARTWHVDVVDHDGRVDDVGAALDPVRWTELRPAEGHVAASVRDDGNGPLDVAVRATRWGRRSVGPARVVASSAWAAYRYQPGGSTDARTIVVLAQPARFDAAAPAVHLPGHVGVYRSPRQGGGTEFASIRPFQPGDRLRRIHWPQSLRTGALHVTSTWADHDRHVVLLVDALDDVGTSGGVDGAPSSLDVVVRAAGAVAEHFVAAGDRVGLVVLSDRGVQRLAAATGHRHLRRLMESLAGINPLPDRLDSGRVPRGLTPGAIVVLLSALSSTASMQRAVAIADHGFTVLVLDCLPPSAAMNNSSDASEAIGWRIRLLEREADMRRLVDAGVPVVSWRGPGSLDTVLRNLHRHAGARLRRRV
jgi:uncharacterized protein (DUF58 family)